MQRATFHSEQYYECKIVAMSGNTIEIACETLGAPRERGTINLETALDDSNRAIEDIRALRNK